MPTAVGAVTVMEPVAEAQVGCVNVAVGATGDAGWALIVTVVAADMQPTLFLSVTL